MRTPAANIATRIINQGHTEDYADVVVADVFRELDQPTREMIAAGLDELNLALGNPKPHDKIGGNPYRRDLVRTIWCAMLDRAR